MPAFRSNACRLLGFFILAIPSLAFAVACGEDSGGGPSGGGGGGGPADSLLTLEPVVTNLDVPVFLTAPAGDSRLFVVEKDGKIRIIKNGTLLTTPFLDITGLTTKGSEQGLLGLAFPPDYATSGRFYVSYTAPGATNGGNSVIARYHVSGDPDIANPASDTTILTFAQPETNHNGGNIVFGPDGFLYLGFGDGGGTGSTAQDGTNLLGDLLRIDVSGPGYTSPPGNPFAASGTIRHEIWAMGLRNPWRWSFDRQTGELYIADVGQNTYEEVDIQPAGSSGGQNYGWPIMEGMHCFSPSSGCDRTGLTLPVLEYDHGDGCAITGGYVYRGAAVPGIQGHYFYSDNCTGFIRSFHWTGSTVTQRKQWDDLNLGSVNSFGEDGNGELYVMTYSGGLYKFASPSTLVVAESLPDPERLTQLARAVPDNILFGTSSWTYPGWKGMIYQQDYPKTGSSAAMLEEYTRFPLFRTVGIDSTFYGPPTPELLASYARVLPQHFRCVSKVWDRLTVLTFPKARYRAMGGEPNPDFLNPDVFLDEVLQLYQAYFPVHTGPFVFEFQTIARNEGVGPLDFANRLDQFFSKLPREFPYAVELRNQDFLTPAYFAVLREHNVAHVYNSWTRMPAIGEQIDLPGSFSAPFTVARVLLRPGRTYSDAVDAFAPYDRIQDRNPELRRDIARLIRQAQHLRIPAYILVNNRAEGSAPITIAAVAELLEEEYDGVE